MLVIRQRLELCADLGHSPVLDLGGPGRVNRHVGGIAGANAQIQREVRYEQRLLVAAESRTGRKQQALWGAVINEPVEVAQLGDNLSGVVDDDDLVRLVGR